MSEEFEGIKRLADKIGELEKKIARLKKQLTESEARRERLLEALENINAYSKGQYPKFLGVRCLAEKAIVEDKGRGE